MTSATTAEPLPPIWRIERHDRVGSTMDIAAARAQAGEPEGLVVVADEQTAGRGRAGRTWQAPPRSALLLTALLRPPLPPDRLSTLALVAGVALAEAVEAVTGLPAWLKWPNDLWLGERNAGDKAAGILATSRLGPAGVEYALLGIGVNVTTPVEALPPGGTSLAAARFRRRKEGGPGPGDPEREDSGGAEAADESAGETGRAGATNDSFEVSGLAGATNENPGLAPVASRDALLAALLDRLGVAYAAFVHHGGRPPLDGWLRRATLLGQDVEVEIGGERRRGVFVGLREDGALLLRVDDGTIEAIVAGDLTRGPRPVVPSD